MDFMDARLRTSLGQHGQDVFNLERWYRALDDELVASGEPLPTKQWAWLGKRFDVEADRLGLIVMPRAFTEAEVAENYRRSMERYNRAPSATVEWFEECQRLHGGSCGASLRHRNRMLIDAQKSPTLAEKR
jgi:hypothetical protein